MRRPILTALLLTLWTSSAAQAASQFAGQSWTVPAGLKPSPYTPECPGRCAMYQATDINATTVYVHEAILADSLPALGKFRGFVERGGAAEVLNDAQETSKDGTVLRLVLLRGGGKYHDFAFLTRGGVTVTLQVVARDLEQLKEALPLLGALADSVKLDPAAITKDIGTRNQTFAQDVQSIAKGYEQGGQAQLYEHSEVVSVNNMTNMGILQTDSSIRTETLAFLPGGVFLRDAGPNYRFPDLRAAWEGEPPARWAAVQGGFKVTLPDGKTAVYKRQPDKEGGSFLNIPDGSKEKIYFDKTPLTAKDLIGSYSRSSSGVSTGLPTTVISSSQEEITLKADGTFEASRSSLSSLSNGPGSLGGNPDVKTDATVEGSGGGRGQWTYHPGSFTLTLKFAGGTVQSGPAYTSSSRRSLNQKKPGSIWRLPGGEGWDRQ